MSKLFEFKIASSIYSKITDGTHDSPKQQDFGKPLITSKHIKGRNIDFENAYLISEYDYSKINERSKVEKWDVIVSMIGEYCGFCYIERNDEIDYAVKNVGLFKTGSELEAEWLYYYLNSSIGKGYLNSLKSGSSQPYLTLGTLRNLPILQPKSVKHKICIVKVLSDLDAKIELNNKINSELEAMAKALYDYWFVQFDFPDANGKPYKTSGGEMVWNDELKKEIPFGWEVEMLFDGMSVQYGFPFNTSKFTDDTTQKPVIRIRDILENTISTYSTENVDEKYRLQSKDLLIGMDGNFHLNFWDKEGCYLNQRSVRIRSKENSEVSNFQALFELTPHIKAREKNVSRTTVGHLSDKDLKRLFVLNSVKTSNFKPKETFDSLLEKVISNRLQNQQLSSLRDWLLPMLMNGQVRVEDKLGIDKQK